MKNNQRAVHARRQNILQMVLDAGEITVADIAQAHNISDMTVRRDLQYLENQNLIWRTHGGANSIEKAREFNLFGEDIALCREKISRYAAGFVNDGDTLFINGSRTALNLLKYLDNKKNRRLHEQRLGCRRKVPRRRHCLLDGRRTAQSRHGRRIRHALSAVNNRQENFYRLRGGLRRRRISLRHPDGNRHQ